MAWYDKWVIMVIAAAIGMAAYHGVPWCKMGVAEWAYWFGAIGSLGAWIGTIWIATYERRERTRREIDSAIVSSGSVVMKIVEIQVTASHTGERLQTFTYSDTEALGFCNKKLEQMTTLDFAEIAALTILPDGVATKLAAAATEIDWCKRQIKSVQETAANGLDDDSIYLCTMTGKRLVALGGRVLEYKGAISSFITKMGGSII